MHDFGEEIGIDLPARGLVHNENLAGSAQGPGKAE